MKGTRGTRRKEPGEEPAASAEGGTTAGLDGLTKVEFFEQQLKILSDLLVDVQQIEEIQREKRTQESQDEQAVAEGHS